jgi:hypothetical protein
MAEPFWSYFSFFAAAFCALAGKLPLETVPPLFLAEALCILDASFDVIFLPILVSNMESSFNLNFY